ncbi:glycoside hydrolase family 28 protein [Hymenobacter psychrotolerans]|uniref:Pectate lyase superfamily protein n=1 Tax=Hymenobacter psychrotolerans DSM 18569 TaxID=1121959 RepID=A0A1M6T9J0_9BACT|nr:hypothetical protein [Hymenobacter psychrotolerans]SHK53516.1 hypothetical protein SAMN02746009_01120 [Hymenobacter psychrotolerans DSM 18569]
MNYLLALALLALPALASAQSFAPTLPPVKTTSFPQDTVRITQFGAVPDGLTANTKAFTDAMEACSRKGGGVVLVPRCHWRTGPLTLRSNVNLHLAAGAFVQFSDNRADYQLIKTNWEGLDAVRNQPLLYGKNLEMVQKGRTPEGEWKKLVASGGFLNEKQDRWYPSEQSLKGTTVKEAGVLTPEKSEIKDFEDLKDYVRPDFLVLDGCQRLLIEGVTFQNSPAWTVHPMRSQDVTVRDITVRSGPYTPTPTPWTSNPSTGPWWKAAPST